MTQGPYRLKILAGDEEWKAGESMYQRGGVRVLETGAHVLRYVVAGTPRQEVIFTQDRLPAATAKYISAAGHAAMWWLPRC